MPDVFHIRGSTKHIFILISHIIDKSDIADIKLHMYNQDGSEGRLAGNALRLVAKYVYDNDICKKNVIKVETLSGVKECKVITKMGIVSNVTVDMGKVSLKPEEVPVKLAGESVINREITIGDVDYNVTCLYKFCREVKSRSHRS